jgi:hypothetical protein
MSTSTAKVRDAVALVKALKIDDLHARLDELEGEQQALKVLLRAVPSVASWPLNGGALANDPAGPHQ